MVSYHPHESENPLPVRWCDDQDIHGKHKYRYDDRDHICPGVPEPAYESVDHPAHYGGDTEYEVIKVLESWNEMFGLTVNITSAIKYLSRAGRKPGVSAEQDLKKALWHIQREIDRNRR